MNLTALRYFHEVAVSGSIRQAAERVHVAASALSRQISKLEHEFDAPLLERRTTGVVLTPAGHLLAQHTRTMFRDLERLKSQVDDLRDLHRGEVKIATIEGIVADLLPEIMSGFLALFPNISFSVTTHSSRQILEQVISDQVDIGITYNAQPRPEIDIALSHPFPSYAVLAPFHELADARMLSVAEVFKHKVALPEASFGLRRLVDAVAFRHGLEVREALRTNSFEMMKAVARTGNAIAILPRTLVRRELAAGQLCAIPVNDPELADAQMQVCIHRNRTLSSAARGFLEHTLAYLRALPPLDPIFAKRTRKDNASSLRRTTRSKRVTKAAKSASR
jgi:DNA-binding transcriptional LysR family regulator